MYCKKPQTPDILPKKLDGFIQRIKLTVPPKDVQENTEDGVLTTPSAVKFNLKAIARIRIPLKRPQIDPLSLE